MLKLTAREKGALFFEGIITVILLVLINLALIIIIQNVIQTNQGVASGIFIIKDRTAANPNLVISTDRHCDLYRH